MHRVSELPHLTSRDRFRAAALDHVPETGAAGALAHGVQIAWALSESRHVVVNSDTYRSVAGTISVAVALIALPQHIASP